MAALDQNVSDVRDVLATLRTEIATAELMWERLREDVQSQQAQVDVLQVELTRLRFLEIAGLERLQELLDALEKSLSNLGSLDSTGSSSASGVRP